MTIKHSNYRETVTAYLMLAPGLAVLGTFSFFPICYAVYLSMTRSRLNAVEFAGVEHYEQAWRSPDFWNSFKVTIYFMAGTVPFSIVLGLGLALMLYRTHRFQRLLRTAFFLPYVTSLVAAAMIWRVMLEPSHGVFTSLLDVFGWPAQTWLLEPKGVLHILFGERFDRTTGPSLALCCVIVFEVWRSTGFIIVVFLAGLTAVPRELEEAARLDGGNNWHVFRHVTLPLLSPTVFFLTIVSVIGSFQAFSSFYALSDKGRGPLDTTQNLIVYMFTQFYEYDNIEYGAAIAIIISASLMVLTLLQWRLIGRRVYYA